jgi:hypothetical protein
MKDFRWNYPKTYLPQKHLGNVILDASRFWSLTLSFFCRIVGQKEFSQLLRSASELVGILENNLSQNSHLSMNFSDKID